MATTTSSPEALGGDDELVFADPSRPAQTRVRRGKAGAPRAAAAADTTIQESEPAPAARSEEPAGAPATIPPADAAPAGSAWRDRALLGIALVTMLGSVASLGAVIEVGRTLAHAQADREQARAELRALDRVPQTIAAIDAASDRLAAASARAASVTAPATAEDLHHELDALKLSLNARQPQGVAQLQDAYRAGFSDLGERMDRLDGRIGALSRQISAGRTASSAGDRARPS